MVNWYCYRLFSTIGSKIGSKMNVLILDNQILVLKRLDCAIEGQNIDAKIFGNKYFDILHIFKQWLLFSYVMHECLKVI